MWKYIKELIKLLPSITPLVKGSKKLEERVDLLENRVADLENERNTKGT